MIAIGIGSQSTATTEDVADIIEAARTAAGVACPVIATLKRGAADVAIISAAHQLGCEVQLLAAADLAARSSECVTRSQASLDAHGVPSVAEGAALAGCGPGSRLIVTRLQRPRVTAAVAASADHDIQEITR